MAKANSGDIELAAATASIRDELTLLAEQKSAKIAALVIYIRDHLFDPELSVARAKTACGVRDNSIAILFHAEVGEPPARFISSRRILAAERLLESTYLPIWRLSSLLGYSSIQVFSRAFFRLKGFRPSETRRRGERERLASPVSPPATAAPRQPDLLGQALAGQLEDQEAAKLIVRLLEIYPPGRRRLRGVPD